MGLFILAFTITFACLKTSIGLVTACAETFSKMTNGKIPYRTWAILFTVFSFAVSNVGLSAIIEYSIPMLMLIYPRRSRSFFSPSSANSSSMTGPSISPP